MKFLRNMASGLVAGAFLFAPSAYADDEMQGPPEWDLVKALTEGEVSASLRYRYGHIEQAGFVHDARASTARVLLGYQTGEFGYFSAFVQGRATFVVGSEDYNSTVNGNVAYPVEADPDTIELDQLYLRFSGIPQLDITVGRRQLNWGNQRFVSSVGWRQNNQSFDGIVVESAPMNGFTFRYAFANNVNRIFTDESQFGDFHGDVHLANVNYTQEFMSATAYAYTMDFDDWYSMGLAAQTYGLNMTLSENFNGVVLGAILEFANQSDFGSNPSSFDADYYRVEPSVSTQGFTLRAGIEVMTGDGSNAFQAPLSLLHAYNGWADKFLVTPGYGLDDRYISASYRFGDHATPELMDGVRVTLAYHEFEAEAVDMEYGSEFDAALIIPVNEHFSTGFKYADYQSDGFSVDTEKFWWFFTVTY